jgi:hypothetical protein
MYSIGCSAEVLGFIRRWCREEVGGCGQSAVQQDTVGPIWHAGPSRERRPTETALLTPYPGLSVAGAGKVVLDATNPLSPYPGLEVRWDHATSGGEVLSAVLPDAHVFKVQQRIEHPMHDC